MSLQLTSSCACRLPKFKHQALRSSLVICDRLPQRDLDLLCCIEADLGECTLQKGKDIGFSLLFCEH